MSEEGFVIKQFKCCPEELDSVSPLNVLQEAKSLTSLQIFTGGH